MATETDELKFLFDEQDTVIVTWYETAKAVLYRVPEGKFWVPRSIMVHADGPHNGIKVPHWLKRSYVKE